MMLMTLTMMMMLQWCTQDSFKGGVLQLDASHDAALAQKKGHGGGGVLRQSQFPRHG